MKAKLELERDAIVAEVDPRLFGGFIEHLGRCVYGGVYEPGHPDADEQGFRRDVITHTRDLGLTVMRYPGGNFVSGYRWEDGVGPKAARPRRLDLAWGALETNQFGTDEFIDWCRKAGVEPMLAVNLGTRGAQEAADLVEYCNHPGGTSLSERRRAHGHDLPHGVKLWCLGNEVYGDWQMGHKTAHEYGRLAHETAKLMKWVDPSIELVLCGADRDWNEAVLTLAYDRSDYLSLHAYYFRQGDDSASFLARGEDMADAIAETVRTCDRVAAKLGQRRAMHIAFDEYNVWDYTRPWRSERGVEAPVQLEEEYTAEDAVVFGSLLITLLNHCDRVKIANFAQLVNVIAPIRTLPRGPSWLQTIHHPLLLTSQRGRGTVLRQRVESPRCDCPARAGVPMLASACVLDRERALNVFAVNRHGSEPLELTIDLSGLGGEYEFVEWVVLHHPDPRAVNGPDARNVFPVPGAGARLEGHALRASLAPVSWNLLRARPRPRATD